MLLGHAHPEVQAAVAAAVARGTSYGAPTEPEVELAEEIVARTPVETVRFVSSGTEATMSAIRLARGFTGRDVVVKFAGCYHGHVDALLASAGSGAGDARACPGTPGVPESATALTLVLPYNDRAAVEEAFAEHGDRIACLITEAAPGNMGVVAAGARLQRVPRRDLRRARRAVRQRRGDDRLPRQPHGPVGPRRRRRGLAARPDDLRQGDGRRLPGRGVRRPRRRDGAARARRGPSTRPAPCPGTRSPPPPGSTTLRLATDEVYAHLTEAGDTIKAAAAEALTAAGVPHVVQSTGTMFSVFFTDRPVRDFAGASAPGHRGVRRVLPRHARRGVHLPPSAYEAWFLSAAHDDRAVQTVLDALPAAARAAAGEPDGRADDRDDRPIVHLLRHGEVHNPDGRALRPARRASTSPTSAGRWRRRSPTPIEDRDIIHLRGLAAGAGAGDRAPLAAGPRPRDRHRRAGDRVDQHVRGRGLRRRRPDAAPAAGLAPPLEPVQALVGRALQATSSTRMMAAVHDARDAARGHEAVIVSHQLPIWITRLHAEKRSFLHDPRRRQCTLCSLTSLHFAGDTLAEVDLLRARRRPDPGRATRRRRSRPAARPRSSRP